MLGWLQEKLRAYNTLPKIYPNLQRAGFAVRDVTSPATVGYNCVAYAAKDETRPWWPINPRRAARYYYWPVEPRQATVQNFILAFETLGYQHCQTGDHEEGYEKVAIYVDEDDKPKHMARELGDGVWASKLGDMQDIRHHTLEAIENDMYGQAKYFMRKPLEATPRKEIADQQAGEREGISN